jgi:hypothetical protein
VEPWFPLTKAGRRASWLCAALLFAAAAAPGDTVRTTAGRAYAGTVSIDGRALRVGPTTMPVGDVLEVTLGRAVRTGRQSCVLANGSTLAGRVEGIDDRIVRVTMPAMGTVPVPVDRVARVCFGPVPGELLAKVPGDGGRGLLLRDGDFFDGQLAGFDGANVTMTSPLLGEATFGVADRAAALVLRPAGRPEGAWVVRTTDGSVLVADDLSLTNGSVRVTVAGVGPMAVEEVAVTQQQAAPAVAGHLRQQLARHRAEAHAGQRRAVHQPGRPDAGPRLADGRRHTGRPAAAVGGWRSRGAVGVRVGRGAGHVQAGRRLRGVRRARRRAGGRGADGRRAVVGAGRWPRGRRRRRGPDIGGRPGVGRRARGRGGGTHAVGRAGHRRPDHGGRPRPLRRPGPGSRRARHHASLMRGWAGHAGA